jgi:hypothetical protein
MNFYKDEQGLPYIDLDGPGEEATIMLLQRVQSKWSKAAGELIKTIETALVQTVRGNYEGYLKKDILKAKEACRVLGMTKEERIHANMLSIIHLEQKVDETVHRIDAELITKLKDKMKVWAYLMTQYNLKHGLRKFGTRGTTAALDELTQLHVMDTWMAMDPSKLTLED